MIAKDFIMSDEPEPPSLSLVALNKKNSYENAVTYLSDIISSEKHSLGTVKPSEKSVQFLKKHFPGTSLKEWNDWKWQIKNSITSASELSNFINLSENEFTALVSKGQTIPLRVTPYYLSLLDRDNPADPLRKSVIPVSEEMIMSPEESEDPLCEELMSPVPGITHRYPDRVLFLTTGFCSTYCRYCTRSRMVGDSNKCYINMDAWDRAIAYIEAHTEIRDVLLSGGDPLTLPEDKLEYLLSRLRKISHVEIIRIGTKVPVVLPQRITTQLVRMLKKYHPLWINIHFTHPDELTAETRQACEKLSDGGIPLGSQTVLLKGINDSVETMTGLFHKLLQARVRPYYLYQCDPIPGSSHFRTPLAKGIEIMKGIRGFTSGLAVPYFVIDAPGGGGKIPILPEYYLGTVNGEVLLKNYKDDLFKYPDRNCI